MDTPGVSPMPVDLQCPACGGGQGLARRVTTVLGRKNTVVVDMTCESCSYEWRTEHTSPDETTVRFTQPERLNAATGVPDTVHLTIHYPDPISKRR